MHIREGYDQQHCKSVLKVLMHKQQQASTARNTGVYCVDSSEMLRAC